SLSHLFCVVVRISPFIRWPNLVCHYMTWPLLAVTSAPPDPVTSPPDHGRLGAVIMPGLAG
ncbi:hypothetical protein ACQ9AW_22565, partial [Escherichia coli]